MLVWAKTYQVCKVSDEQERDFLSILGLAKAIKLTKSILCKSFPLVYSRIINWVILKCFFFKNPHYLLNYFLKINGFFLTSRPTFITQKHAVALTLHQKATDLYRLLWYCGPSNWGPFVQDLNKKWTFSVSWGPAMELYSWGRVSGNLSHLDQDTLMITKLSSLFAIMVSYRSCMASIFSQTLTRNANGGETI